MSDPKSEHVAVRLDTATIARIDALAPRVAFASIVPTRSDIMRALIGMALEDAEKNPEAFAARYRSRR